MKKTHPALQPMVVATMLAGTLVAGIALASEEHPGIDLRQTTPIHGNATAGKASSNVCAACHGADGEAVSAQFPDLAGQSATYLYVQLKAFKQGWRENAVMQAQVKSLDEEAMRNLAAYYASLPAKAATSAQPASVGARLFHAGDPATGIPPCEGCHGPDGTGPQPDRTSTMAQPAWSTFPALAGQSSDYIVQQLQAYKDGKRSGSTNTAIMHGVVQNLDEKDMHALATYISKM